MANMPTAVADAIADSILNYAHALTRSHRGEDRRSAERIHAIYNGIERRSGNDRRADTPCRCTHLRSEHNGPCTLCYCPWHDEPTESNVP